MLAKPVLCLVTPGTRGANNGNWRTAARWAEMLRDRYRVIVQTQWEGEHCDALVALHAKRSAASIARFADSRAGRVGVVLTGTDLYRDLPQGGEAAASLDIAARIVALQEDAPRLLPAKWRRKCGVIFQSARSIAHRATRGPMRCIVVGHLREEKDPLTVLRAIAALPPDLPIRVRHVGAALDKELAREARAFAAREPRYRYAGPLPHGLTRAAIAASDLLIHPSLMEGGANVIVEAVTAGTPVVASHVSGNIGMLGKAYPGFFPVGDAQALARSLRRAVDTPDYLRRLRQACKERKPLFSPARESRAVHDFVLALLA